MHDVLPIIFDFIRPHLDTLVTALVALFIRKVEKKKMKAAWDTERERLLNSNGIHE
jgi:hypothetical protein